LSVVRDCLFDIFAATLYIWRQFFLLQKKHLQLWCQTFQQRHIWQKTEYGSSSQETATVLSKHLIQRALQSEHIVFYSDACTRSQFLLISINATISANISPKDVVSDHSFLLLTVTRYNPKNSPISHPREYNETVRIPKTSQQRSYRDEKK
jgi:hypothetical protein